MGLNRPNRAFCSCETGETVDEALLIRIPGIHLQDNHHEWGIGFFSISPRSVFQADRSFTFGLNCALSIIVSGLPRPIRALRLAWSSSATEKKIQEDKKKRIRFRSPQEGSILPAR